METAFCKPDKFLERYLPIIISTICTIVIYKYNIKTICNIKDIVMSIINFIAILSGFFTTMLSILITSTDKPIMNNIKEAGRLAELFYYVSIPIIIGFCNIGSCLMFLSYITEGCILYELKSFYTTMFLTILFIATSIRSIIIITLIMKEQIENPNKPERKPNLDRAFNGGNHK